MNYHSAFLWEKGKKQEENRISLLLQQVTIRKQAVLFACVCEGTNLDQRGVLESGYFTEALVEWFHRDMLRILEKKWSEREVEKSLQKEVDRILGEIRLYAQKKGFQEGLRFRGILLIDNLFWMFSRGKVNGYLVNRRLNQKNIRQIDTAWEKQQVCWEAGSIQKKVGMLLCIPQFVSFLDKAELTEVLAVEEKLTEERLQKRLQELWRVNVSRGEEGEAAAVYIRTG